MHDRTVIKILFLGLFLWTSLDMVTASPLADEAKILFIIERSRDADIVVYEARQKKNGNLDTKKPLDIYWMKLSQNGEREPLTKIQNNRGYGIKILEATEQSVKFTLVSFEKHVFHLRKNQAGQYKVYTANQNKEIEIKKIYIKFQGDSFWFPVILSVELYGLDQGKETHLTIVSQS